MKTTFYSLLMAGLLVGCQHEAPPVVKATAEATAPTAVAETKPLEPTRPPAADSLSLAAMLALLRQHDLAPLWGGYEREDVARRPLEGFYGPPYYRISFYFTSIVRDLAQPNLFRVTGLNRYKKVITPFSGTITVHTLRPFTKEMFLDAAPADSAAPAYTAVARFALDEDPTTKGAGNYTGEALLDFYLNHQQQLQLAISHPMASEHNPTGGAGLIFRGSHVSNQTGRRKSVAFSTDYGMVVPQPLQKLGIGDRSEEVNPNLARLGWNEAWENDEWWADSPTPKLSL